MRLFISIFLFLSSLGLQAQSGPNYIFDEPECLQPSIYFWVQIFTVYGENDAIIHDNSTFQIHKIIKAPRSNKKARSEAINKAILEVKDKLPASRRDNVRIQSGIKERFSKGLILAIKLIPQIKKQLGVNLLPEELAFIPLIESSFQFDARSKVGARGAWQIMPQTLRIFNKAANKKQLDDLDFSTKIAISIFSSYYSHLQSWPLTINAYHSGVGRLSKAKNTLNTSDICTITSQYQEGAYKFASRNYYAQFLAAKRLYEANEEILNLMKTTRFLNR